ARAGKLGGTADVGAISSIPLADGAVGSGYNFPMDRPPVFTSTPIVEVVAGKTYTYVLTATDPDGDTLHYSVVTAPVPDLVSGNVLSWSPTAAAVGPYTVALLVEDGWGGSAKQDFILNVTTGLPDRPPIFTSSPVVDAYVGAAYMYQ